MIAAVPLTCPIAALVPSVTAITIPLVPPPAPLATDTKRATIDVSDAHLVDIAHDPHTRTLLLPYIDAGNVGSDPSPPPPPPMLDDTIVTLILPVTIQFAALLAPPLFDVIIMNRAILDDDGTITDASYDIDRVNVIITLLAAAAIPPAPNPGTTDTIIDNELPMSPRPP